MIGGRHTHEEKRQYPGLVTLMHHDLSPYSTFFSALVSSDLIILCRRDDITTHLSTLGGTQIRSISRDRESVGCTGNGKGDHRGSVHGRRTWLYRMGESGENIVALRRAA